MKAEELMIGDWVYITEPDDFHGYIGKVVITNAETNYIAVRIPNMHLHDVFVEDLQPIPLTEEILEKNGYKFNYICYEKKGYPAIELGSEEGTYNIGKVYVPYNNGDPDIHVYTTCKYVHELQHAIKLCGIEKNIIL